MFVLTGIFVFINRWSAVDPTSSSGMTLLLTVFVFPGLPILWTMAMAIRGMKELEMDLPLSLHPAAWTWLVELALVGVWWLALSILF